MSRKNNTLFDDLAVGIVFLIVAAIWAAIVGFVKLTISLATVPPDKQLRRLEGPGQWGVVVGTTTCSACKMANEFTRTVCSFCGTALPLPQALAPITKPPWEAADYAKLAGIILLLGFLISIFAFN